MALAATVDWDVQTGGNDANGGGFNTSASGTDRSQATSPHVTIDGASITAVVHSVTTQLTLSGYTVSAADVGNVVNISGGTATQSRYEITAVDTGNNRWTLDRSCGTASQTATGRMGGCLATPGKLGKILSTSSVGASGQYGHIKDGTYTLSTTTADSGGPFLNSGCMAWIVGYNSTHWDCVVNGKMTYLTSKPILHAGTQTGVSLWQQSYGNIGGFINLEANGNSKSGVSGFYGGYPQHEVFGCCAKNCNQTGCWGFRAVSAMGSVADSCYYGVYVSAAVGCRSTACAYGFFNTTALHCLADRCTTYGFYVPLVQTGTYCCSADRNAIGFYVPGNANLYECVSTRSTTYNFQLAGANMLFHCAGYNTGTANYTPSASRPNYTYRDFITLTGDPFVDSAASDYRLNTTAGAGAALRGVGYGVWGQTDYASISAVTTIASGGGGPRMVNIRGGVDQ